MVLLSASKILHNGTLNLLGSRQLHKESGKVARVKINNEHVPAAKNNIVKINKTKGNACG